MDHERCDEGRRTKDEESKDMVAPFAAMMTKNKDVTKPVAAESPVHALRV